MWTGDSIAYDLAPAVVASLGAAGVRADDSSFPGTRLIPEGGGTSLLDTLAERLTAKPVDVVVMQLSVWDSEQDTDEQYAALAALRELVHELGAQLVLVPPPVSGDTEDNAFYAGMTEQAARIAAEDPAGTVLLDPTAVWGTEAVLDLDGDATPERKRDLIHVCPSGAARFALWLSTELDRRFDGVAPAPATDWATGEWVTDPRYDEPVGACAPLG
jgi:hypothetical protein